MTAVARLVTLVDVADDVAGAGQMSVSVEVVEQTARAVVGPDEPLDGRSPEDAEEGHWAS